MVLKASAFSPSHITGFFQIFSHSDMLKAGSRGCGVVIDKGTRADVLVEEGDVNAVEVFLNGVPCRCPVSKMVADEILKLANGSFSVEVSQSVDVPLRYGFGASAAGALSTGLALNKALGLELSDVQIGQIAHFCEVKNMTGLGDVVAELYGGLVVREREGAPGVGHTYKIPSDGSVVVFIIGGEIETREILADDEKRERITRMGGRCLDLFLKDPTQDNFLRISKRFSEETGLLSREVKETIGRLETQGVCSSMSMLGNSVFTITEDPDGVCEMLDYKYIVADIDTAGARLV